MTREEFIEILKKEGYSYKIEGSKIVVTYRGTVHLNFLTSLPPDVEFKNGRDVDLHSLTSISHGVAFRNGGYVYLSALTSLSPGVEFRNRGYVYLSALTSLPPGVGLKNGGGVYLKSLTGDWFSGWSGNIEGISSNMLLNMMISKGVFI